MPGNKKRQRRLNQNQLDLINLCFKFRFIESGVVACHRQKGASTVNQSLRRLMKSGLITRNYPKHYSIQGRPAEYYLSLDGIGLIKSLYDTSPRAKRAMYRNPSLSPAFVSKCLRIYHLYVQLQKQYGKKLKMFTKSETVDIEDMPRPHPDLYMQFGKSEYYLDLLDQERYFVIRRRVGQIFKDFEQTDLENSSYPTILLVLDNKNTQKKISKFIDFTKSQRLIADQDLIFMTTTIELLDNPADKKVWTMASDSQTLVDLKSRPVA